MAVELNSKSRRVPAVARSRRYAIQDTDAAKAKSARYLEELGLRDYVFGLPEVDDRYHIWRVPILREDELRLGEVVLDARTGAIDQARSTHLDAMLGRVNGFEVERPAEIESHSGPSIIPGRNVIISGESPIELDHVPAEVIGLMFTSPPYFNARPQYSEYHDYAGYLSFIESILRQVHRVLGEGRFAVMNVSPVLVRRAKRSEASTRIAVPFDMHELFIRAGFEFIDDIIWVKPEGSGWATGRGRRFAADRNPLQYKAVPVTEYVLVYRKRTSRLIDWNIRTHHDHDAVRASKISDGYERTNVWRINPATDPVHPAVFPEELAEKVIRYYSFEGDTVLDPFAGVGTVGAAAARLRRAFVLVEKDPQFVDEMKTRSRKWLGPEAAAVQSIHTPSIDTSRLLL